MYSKWCRVWFTQKSGSHKWKRNQKLCQRTDKLIQVIFNFIIICHYSISFPYFLPLFICCMANPMEAIYYGIPNAVLFNFWCYYYFWNFFLYQLHGVLYNLFVFEDQNQCIEWKSIRNEEKKTIHKNQRNSSIIWFVIFRDQWIQHYFLVEIFVIFWMILWLTVISLILTYIYSLLRFAIILKISYLRYLGLHNNFLNSDIHGFFSDLFCEQILQNIEFIVYIVF